MPGKQSPIRTPPAPGQESVWDYPRPPRLEQTSKRIEVWFAGEKIADSRQAWRVLETSHPPVYYLPPGDVNMAALTPASGTSICEWKGSAAYFDLTLGETSAQRAAWTYPTPLPDFTPIANHIAFYPAAMDECRVDGERVQPQPGTFYGGWVTSDIVGPFKGEPGSQGW